MTQSFTKRTYILLFSFIGKYRYIYREKERERKNKLDKKRCGENTR